MPNNFFKEVLSNKQTNLLPLVRDFMKDFGLVGGTALALQVGHRRSIDFDLFSNKEFTNQKIKNLISKQNLVIEEVLAEELEQLTLLVNGVQITFLRYPFDIKFKEDFQGLRMPDLLTLACMKAQALGRRAKWKDYVDLFFILKEFATMKEIIERSKEIYKGEFNEKLFRQQLSYFEDIDYSETIDFLPGFEVEAEKIKKELIKFSLEISY